MAGFLGGGGGGGASTINYNITNNSPSGWLNIVDFDAVSDGSSSGGTDNTTAIQGCIDACRSQGKGCYIPAGDWATGALNRQGVWIHGDGSDLTNVYGLEGEDIFGTLGYSEVGYVRPSQEITKGLTVWMHTAVDHRTDFNRVSFGGHRIGPAAFVIPESVWLRLEDVHVRSATAAATTLNGCAAIFCNGSSYGLTLDKVMAREVSFGFIDGIDDTDTRFHLRGPCAEASSTITYTAHGFIDNDQVAFIWDINETTCDLSPRVRYYVINAAADTFQVSLTQGGAAVTITADAAWAPWVVYAGDSAFEYANDERNFGRLIVPCAEAGIVLCNGNANVSTMLALQTQRVSAQLLNYQSLVRVRGEGSYFGQFMTEGPLDSTWGADKEAWRIEWDKIVCAAGPELRGHASLTGLYATISGWGNRFGTINVATGRVLNITGHRNLLPDVRPYQREGGAAGGVHDQGVGNLVRVSYVGDGGDIATRLPMLDRRIPRLPFGGFDPTYIEAQPDQYFPGKGWLFIPGTSMKTQVAGTPVYDEDLETGGYMLFTSGAFELRTLFGSSQYVLTTAAGAQTMPKCKCRIRAKVQIAATDNLTMGGTWLAPGSGSIGSVTTAMTSGAWAIVEFEADLSAYAAPFQLTGTGPAANLLVEWIYVQPIAAEQYCSSIHMGSRVLVTQYAGSPENNVTADPGSFCLDTTNGAAYIKTTGTSNTGWAVVTHA